MKTLGRYAGLFLFTYLGVTAIFGTYLYMGKQGSTCLQAALMAIAVGIAILGIIPSARSSTVEQGSYIPKAAGSNPAERTKKI